MSIDTKALLNTPTFKNLNPELLSRINVLIPKINDKPTNVAMPIIADFINKLPSNLKPTKDQEKALLKEIMRTLTPIEQAKVNTMLKMNSILKK